MNEEARRILRDAIDAVSGSWLPPDIVAAGSVVTGDREPDCLYAGAPAELKRHLD